MNLLDVVLLLSILFFGYLFWQWRRQDEHARQYAGIYCKQNNLQLLEIARHKGRPVYRRGLVWQAEFEFDFSSDHESRYTGTLTMLNLRLKSVAVPPHRVLGELPTHIRYGDDPNIVRLPGHQDRSQDQQNNSTDGGF